MTDADHRLPRILIDDRQASHVDADALEAIAREALVGEGIEACELSLSFIDEEEMSALHERFTGGSGPTDVLSFPLEESDVDEDGVRILGDVVIAPAVAERNNPGDRDGELRLLVVHGILHLLGHDHAREEEREAMWSKQERYAGIRVP